MSETSIQIALTIIIALPAGALIGYIFGFTCGYTRGYAERDKDDAEENKNEGLFEHWGEEELGF